MPANTSVWKFEQLGGLGATLLLSDHAAPHGRAHKGAVVEAESELREDSVYYAGNEIPTRHIFGTKDHSYVLKGRFKDSYGGLGFAREKRLEVEKFFREAQQCLVSWDDLISALVLIKRVKFGIESGASITYEIECLVDSGELDATFGVRQVEPRGPQDMTAQINAALADMNKLTEVPGMRGSVFDSVSSLIASVASVSSALNSVAGQIDSFANAPFQLLNQLRAVLDQFRTAVTALRRTYDGLQVNIALENENAGNYQGFWDVQSAWSVSSLDAIREAIAMDRAAVLAQQGSIQALYIAQGGDTWESVSRAAYNGSPDRAQDIREANGVNPGQNPVPGVEYMVPV